MKSLLLPVALILLGASSCNLMSGGNKDKGTTESQPAAAATPTPDWVFRPLEHPKYPPSRFMVNVGNAPVDGNLITASESAMENGRTKISSEMNSKLKSVTESLLKEVGINDDVTTTSEYLQRIQNNTESLLIGSKEAGRYHDVASNSMYVLVVLDRQIQARGVLDGVGAALAKVGADNEQGTAAGRLKGLIEQHVALDEIMAGMVTLNVVVKQGLPIYAEYQQSYAELKKRMATVISAYRDSNLSLSVVGGNGQQGYADSSLAEPIVFQAMVNGDPLVGFPVTFRLEHPERGEISEATRQTGSDGRLSCKVVGLKLTGDEENSVVASLDYDRLGEMVFEAPSAEATFTLPTLRTVTFAILIDERNLDEVQPESAVGGSLKRALGTREARVMALSSFLSASDLKQVANMSPADLEKKLGGRIDYLIRGTARSRFSSNNGNIFYCYGGGRLELIDIRTHQILRTLDFPVTGTSFKKPNRSKVDAGISALMAFAEEAEKSFMKSIDTTFQVE